MFRRHAFLLFLLVVQACGLRSKDEGEKCLSHGVDIPSICDGINDKFTSPSGGTLGAGGNLDVPGAGGAGIIIGGSGGTSAGGSLNGSGGSVGAGGAASASGGTSFGGQGGATW